MNTYYFTNTNAIRIGLKMYVIVQRGANTSGSITFWGDEWVRGPFNYSNILTELVEFRSSQNWIELVNEPQPPMTMR